MANSGKCSGCCIRQMDCKACARCLPKYLCANVIVEPGPYTDTSCCDPEEYTGDGQFSFKLNNGCDVWTGSGGCPNGPSLDLSVALSADCQSTLVTSSLTDEVFSFDGIVPSGMAGVIEDIDGNVFHWEISSAAVVENPLAKDDCSPCVCLQCLPEKFCVTLSAKANGDSPAVKVAFTAQWDCPTRSWTPLGGLPAGVDFSIALTTAKSGVCGVVINASANGGSYSGVTSLDGGMPNRRFHGTPCVANDGSLSFTEGIPEVDPCPEDDPECPEPPPARFNNDITISGDLISDTYQPIGSFTIRDQTCGDCVLPCEPSGCCPNVIIPKKLHVTSSAPPGCANCGEGSTSWIANEDPVTPGEWEATQIICGTAWTIRFWCLLDYQEPGDNPPAGAMWVIGRYCDGQKANSNTNEEFASRSCDPFYLKFTSVLFSSADSSGKPCNCLDQYGNADVLFLDFEVTA